MLETTEKQEIISQFSKGEITKEQVFEQTGVLVYSSDVNEGRLKWSKETGITKMAAGIPRSSQNGLNDTCNQT